MGIFNFQFSIFKRQRVAISGVQLKIRELKLKILHDESGQSLIEIIVGLAIGAMLIGAASFAISQTLQSNISIQKAGSAVNMSQELLSKARAYGLANWQNLYGLTKTSSTQYYINASGTSYVVIQGKEGLLDNDVTNGLIGEWKFDEYEGTTSTVVYDSSANGKNGTLMNGPTRATSTCKIANCLSFDDINDYVATPAISYGNDVTMSVWFKGGTQTAADWNYWIQNASNRFEFGTFSNGITFKDNGAVGTPSVGGGSTSLDNNWHNAIGIVRSNVMEIWVDGMLISTRSDYPTGQTHTNEIHNLGGNGGIRYWGGYLDDVRIYNRALSADEVGQVYKSAIFTRYFYVENTCRTNDASSSVSGVAPCGSITPTSSDDPSTQKVTSITEWPTKASTGQVSFSDYITRSRNVIFQQTDWSGGVSGGVDTSPQSTFTSSTNVNSSGGSIRIQGL
ncbi:MAG: LamG-like jellyroll fold domain-containing protein [Candidatus Paceibacterota bacterium]|jgi:hypothetical protein